MSNLRSELIKLAAANPGTIREKVLAVLKEAAKPASPSKPDPKAVKEGFSKIEDKFKEIEKQAKICMASADALEKLVKETNAIGASIGYSGILNLGGSSPETAHETFELVQVSQMQDLTRKLTQLKDYFSTRGLK